MQQNEKNTPKFNDEPPDFLRDMIEAVKADTPEDSVYNAARQKIISKIHSEQKESLIMKIIKNTISGRIRLATAAGISALIIIGLIIINPFGRNTNQSYAAVIERLKKAAILCFNADLYLSPNQPPLKMKFAYKEKGLQRIEMTTNNSTAISIIDTNQNKGITLMPEYKTYIETNLVNAPAVEKERIELINMITNEIKNLPDKAEDVVTHSEKNDESLVGYKVGSIIMWIDTNTNELVSMEKQMAGSKIRMTDFQINPEENDDLMFSITPPAEYTAAVNSAVSYDISEVSEKDLVDYLRFASMMIVGDHFPSTINPMEMMSLGKEGKLKTNTQNKIKDEEENTKAFVKASQNSMVFVMRMKPENEWHYAGEGVSRGDAKTPIAWWKPEGAEKFNVIWGDLSITNLSKEEIDEALKNSKK